MTVHGVKKKPALSVAPASERRKTNGTTSTST
jgi:hypothetical protein